MAVTVLVPGNTKLNGHNRKPPMLGQNNFLKRIFTIYSQFNYFIISLIKQKFEEGGQSWMVL
jgi:hypothetical protein